MVTFCMQKSFYMYKLTLKEMLFVRLLFSYFYRNSYLSSCMLPKNATFLTVNSCYTTYMKSHVCDLVYWTMKSTRTTMKNICHELCLPRLYM